MNIIEPFSTFNREIPDFNNADKAKESLLLMQRQEVIQNTLLGLTDAEFLLDVLEAQGINPVEYVDMVEKNVEFIISKQIFPEDADDLIIIP